MLYNGYSITLQVSDDVSRLLYELYVEDASGNPVPSRNMHNVSTDLKSRPTFQANFDLRSHESKDETLRRIGEVVPSSKPQVTFSALV